VVLDRGIHASRPCGRGVLFIEDARQDSSGRLTGRHGGWCEEASKEGSDDQTKTPNSKGIY
jgi:hypothetical protein